MAIPEEDYSEWPVGDTADPLLCTFVDRTPAKKPFDLALIDPGSLRLRIDPDDGAARDGAGSWLIVDAAAGQAAYAFAAADVATAGLCQVQARYTIGGKTKHFLPKKIHFVQPV